MGDLSEPNPSKAEVAERFRLNPSRMRGYDEELVSLLQPDGIALPSVKRRERARELRDFRAWVD